ncbi:MAG: iron-sulfur cluster repair di-iron protein [Thermoanaerobaculia bacterium]|nr:iron-sulfur cluster repair di-iron protein [Thermoanaerobaculia bacterium]
MSTTTIFAERTVGELAVEVPDSIRVFEAWKIDYCCGGKTPLAEACAAAGKTVDAFAAAMESLARVPDSSQRDWTGDSLTTIAAHIVKTYHGYTREELETLDPLAVKVLGVHGDRRPELADVVALVRELAADLVPHMLKEEQVLFPYVDQLQGAVDGNGPAPTPFFGTVKNPVRMMMLEHDRVGELLAKMRSLTGDFIPPESACFSYQELYRRLAEFERLTHEHIHVENNLYFPRAVAVEEVAGRPKEFAHGAGDHAGACGCQH